MITIKPKNNDKEYIFKATILVGDYIVGRGKMRYKVKGAKAMPWRRLAILGRQSLYKFAESIVDSFEFYFDHCFGFYSNVDTYFYHDSERKYELFADLDDVEPTDAESVKKTSIAKVWNNPGDKMIFLFDYGDGWRFLIELLEINQADAKNKYPVLLEEFRHPPEQYPPADDF